MPRIAKADVHRSLERAAQAIVDAGGTDGRISRKDIKAKVKGLAGTEKKLVDIFFKFIDHRDHRDGATVTKKDVDRAVAYAKQKMVDKYDLNQNGLSGNEISRMSLTGKLAVQLAKELKAAGGVEAKRLPELEMQSIATQFVIDNASDGYSVDDGKLFPGIDSGEEGLDALLMPGESGQRLADFMDAFEYKPRQYGDFKYDPEQHRLLMVRNSPYVEKSIYVSALDRESGDISYLGSFDLYDMPWSVSQEDFERIIGPVAGFTYGGSEYDEIDDYELSGFLTRGADRLDIGNPEADW